MKPLNGGSLQGEGRKVRSLASDPAQPTPGPWTVDEPMWTKVFAGNMTVCDIRGWGFLTGIGGLHLPDEKAFEIQKANARLIAAAPDLLEACEAVKAFLDNLEANTDPKDPLSELRKRIHAPLRAKLTPAIAKATTAHERTSSPNSETA